MEYSSVWGARIPESRSRFFLESTIETSARVAAGQRIEHCGRGRRDPWVEGAKLSGQHALAEPPVTPAQHRAAVCGELHGGTEARRPQVPGVQRSQTADDAIGFPSRRINRAQVLADGAAVVEPHSRVDREPVPDGDGVTRKGRGRDEKAARQGGIARDGLKRPSVVVDEPYTGRNDAGPVALALFDLRADFPLVIGARSSDGR